VVSEAALGEHRYVTTRKKSESKSESKSSAARRVHAELSKRQRALPEPERAALVFERLRVEYAGSSATRQALHAAAKDAAAQPDGPRKRGRKREVPKIGDETRALVRAARGVIDAWNADGFDAKELGARIDDLRAAMPPSDEG
jgi:hypothetical protein